MSKPIVDEIEKFFAPWSNMTEEEWARHDEKIKQKLAGREAEERAEREAERRYRFVDNGFPLRALEAAKAADETAPALVRVKEWDAASESVLVLSGPPGCGKTVAATWWAWNHRPWAVFLRATAFAAASRYDQERRSRWLEASELVLDDLGTEYSDAKGNFQVDLDELIDVFYGNRRPLIITTNCTADEFKQRYGARVVDRLRECGSWFSIKSGSLRRKP